jgi:hypothetical protein
MKPAMTTARIPLLRRAAARGKYAPLFRHLSALDGPEWSTSFAEIERILGFALPDSARIYRPWWANQRSGGGHSHALAWQAAGWRTRAVDLEAETLAFERAGSVSDAARAPRQQPRAAFDAVWPVHDPGPWPTGMTLRREDMYGDDGR